MKLTELINFVAPFALNHDEKKQERVIESKSQTSMKYSKDASGYYVLTSPADLKEKVLNERWASVVYIADKNQIEYVSVIEEIAKKYFDFITVALYVIDDSVEARADLKREFE